MQKPGPPNPIPIHKECNPVSPFPPILPTLPAYIYKKAANTNPSAAERPPVFCATAPPVKATGVCVAVPLRAAVAVLVVPTAGLVVVIAVMVVAGAFEAPALLDAAAFDDAAAVAWT